VWNLEFEKEIKTLIGHSYTVRNVKISKVGKKIISGSDDGTIKIWNIRTG